MTATVENPAESGAASAGTGRVARVIGPVVDVEFPDGKLPKIFSALKLTNPGISSSKENLTLEVAQHLGESTVRAVPPRATSTFSA